MEWAQSLRSHWQRRGSDPNGTWARIRSEYFEGNPYAIEDLEDEEGYFYFAAWNPDRVGSPSQGGCNAWPFWVAPGGTPPEAEALTPELMAETAYDRLPLPETTFSINPEGAQKVNLATWVWQDTAALGEVSVTASLASMDWQVTVTAVPTSLRIDPGTDDARPHPTSRECTIGTDGTIGDKWQRGRTGEPPCGVTYRRSGDYELTATLNWEVSWSGTSSPEPQPMPSATLESPQEITVEEIQTVIVP